MKTNSPKSKLLQSALSNNQDFHRLKQLNPISTMPTDLQDELKALSTSTDTVHKYAVVFLIAVLTKGKSVIVVSQDDLQRLANGTNTPFRDGLPKIDQKRGTKGQEKTIYSQLMGFLTTNGCIKVLKPAVGRSPQVWEVIYPEYQKYLEAATDAIRLQVINSTLKVKYDSYESYKTNDTNKANESYNTYKAYYSYKGKQGHDEGINEGKDERQSETQDETQQDEVIDITGLQQAAVRPKTLWGPRRKNIV